jgi:hypothetical protein
VDYKCAGYIEGYPLDFHSFRVIGVNRMTLKQLEKRRLVFMDCVYHHAVWMVLAALIIFSSYAAAQPSFVKIPTVTKILILFL